MTQIRSDKNRNHRQTTMLVQQQITRKAVTMDSTEVGKAVTAIIMADQVRRLRKTAGGIKIYGKHGQMTQKRKCKMKIIIRTTVGMQTLIRRTCLQREDGEIKINGITIIIGIVMMTVMDNKT